MPIDAILSPNHREHDVQAGLDWIAVVGAGVSAGILAIVVTLVIERMGGIIGGILGTLPTTIIPAAIGMHAAAASTEEFRIMMGFVPVGMLLNAGLLAGWRVVPPLLQRHHATRSMVFSLTALLTIGGWFIAAIVIVGAWRMADADASMAVTIGIAAAIIMMILGITMCWRLPVAPRGTRPVPALILLLRGLGAATAIAVAVLVADLGAPGIAGVASIFPAIFITTMVGLWVSQGKDVPMGATGPMILGSLSISVYGLIGMVLIPGLGGFTGSLCTWVISVVLVSIPAYAWLNRSAATRGKPDGRC